MEELRHTPQDQPRRRRRKRTRLQIFKEVYLPVIILAATALFVVAVVAGSIGRAVNNFKAEKELAAQESKAAEEQLQQLTDEASALILEADALAAIYDYDGAIACIDSFSGSIDDFPDLSEKRASYVTAQSQLVAWDDPSEIPNLSFQLLIADPERAFSDETYGSAYNRNYVTTDEFSKILQQLYDNGYILVSLRDIVETTVSSDGTSTFSANTLYLPPDKKPLVLTQCAVNYFTYMTDGDGDGLPDADGDGFASKLILDSDGNFTNEMVDAQGNLVTGSFDLVPILEDFIAEHPDFSYRGARAILAVTGYDGVFGYRTDYDTKDSAEADYYSEQVTGAKEIVQALRNGGYEIACYTYDNIAYGNESVSRIEEDLSNWATEVTPVLGDVGILVYPLGSDIAEYTEDAYSGDRYNALRSAGFRYFIGMDSSVTSWADVNDDYFRMTRRLVTGAYMAYSPEIFADLFDASTVLSSARGTVPTE